MVATTFAENPPKGVPANAIRLSPFIPGMGGHWADPKTLPLGPIYLTHHNKLIGMEYMTSVEMMESINMPTPEGPLPMKHISGLPKGMEFNHVYLMGIVEDQLPSWAAVKKGDDSHEMQEERRNCFVAITRTQESLTMTFAENVFGWSKAPSRFLTEMGISL